jgi:low affinity Fe/Cu permease
MQESKRPSGTSEPLETVPDTSSPAFASPNPVAKAFDTFASAVTRWAGSPIAFGIAVIIIVAWVVSGPLFHYSDGWQLVINTGTTIVTFLMVFLIQQSANKDSVAVHLKLNELIASHRQANNLLIGIEDATETDLRRIAEAYARIAAQSMPAAADEPELQSEVERRIEKAQSSEAKPT